MKGKILELDINKFVADVSEAVNKVEGKNVNVRVAEIVGVSPMTVYQTTKGLFKNPSFNVVINFCRWMGKDINHYIK